MLSLIAHYYPLIIMCLSCSIIGLTAGMLGVFAFLKKQSLLGDTISHASLPGIVLALIITQQKNPAFLLLGGAIAGTIGTLLILIIQHTTRLQKDTILGIILSVFFGTGLLLVSHLQKFPSAQQALINKFLFGNAAIILIQDLYLLAAIGIVLILILLLAYKELLMLTFDPNYTQSIGYNKNLIELLYTALLVLTIVVGLQTIGVILMSSLLIAPAAAARQWTSQLKYMLLIACTLGMVMTTAGGIVSTWLHVPSGPTIVVLLSSCVVISLLFAPKHGSIWKYLRAQREVKS